MLGMESGLVGKSPSFLKALAAARRAAASCHPVFICGATGTGKEGVAALIHDHSPARRGPFVALNCSALPENLLEAELFGVEGKVPGMVFDKPLPGKFLLADGGTLFLDEISDLSATAQAKLLRVVETGRFFPVCGRSERSARVSTDLGRTDPAPPAGGTTTLPVGPVLSPGGPGIHLPPLSPACRGHPASGRAPARATVPAAGCRGGR
ncbi:sigma 54-interacting transcriptional regulator [bacterium]|nr:sigma 54-interacting transcriptional regulator [bacterium]